jgi:ATP-dependent DNA helicase RecG
MLTLFSPINELPKVGIETTKSLKKLGVETVQDLLFYFPYKYLDFSKFSAISSIKLGEVVTIKGVIKTIQARYAFRSRLSLCEAVVSDDSGSIKVVWFNQPYLAKTLKNGDEVLLSGKAEKYKVVQLTNPIYEKFSDNNIHTGRLVPVYHATENLYNRTVRSLAKHCLDLADQIDDLTPVSIRKKFDLLPLGEAIRQVHFPDNHDTLKQGQTRIIFDEVFVQQLAVRLHKDQLKAAKAVRIPADVELVKQFTDRLPFRLTNSQKQALWEIMTDMDKASMPMNRLLEGDVGSGKTVVALLAALQSAKAGKQTVLLAPTEILARQHYESFRSLLQPYPYAVGLLTRNFRMVNDQTLTKSEIKQSIQDVPIIIGTHALLQEGISLPDVGLVIIDEQHRFGVQQRKTLLQDTLWQVRPHLLSMSATPIPRTLALSLYSDLDISRLTELPRGRQTITTKLVSDRGRAKAYQFVRQQLKAGYQVFIVTPRVEETEASAMKSVKQEAARLQKEVFPEFKVTLIHGKMKGTEKEQIMTDFYNRQSDILVATSVIEIGIDVPNATVMVIENAERFGLAQLHQLRGRVGRGSAQSYCLLFTQSEDIDTINRLKEFSSITDGFRLAELDLKQRGFGSLFGTEQTGWEFRFSRFLTVNALKLGQQAAEAMLKTDKNLRNHPQLRKLVEPLLEQIHLE